MKTYDETITWYDASETKPRHMEPVLITVGTKEKFNVDIGKWSDSEQRWYYGCDYGDYSPESQVWSWSKMPKAIQFKN